MTEDLLLVSDVLPQAVLDEWDRRRAELQRRTTTADYGPDRAKSLRDRDTPVQRQHNKHCTAYATVAAMENVVGDKTKLSEDSLWAHYRHYLAADALEAAQKDGASGRGGVYHLASYASLDDANPFLQLAAALDAGHACVAALSVPQGMQDWNTQVEDTSPMTRHGHAVCVSGYKVDGGRPYFDIKNSWGTHVGDGGYQRLSYLDFPNHPNGYLMFWSLGDVRRP